MESRVVGSAYIYRRIEGNLMYINRLAPKDKDPEKMST